MQVEINTKPMIETCRTIKKIFGSVVGAKASEQKNVLGCHIEAHKDRLDIESSHGGTYLKFSVPANVEHEGGVLINGHYLMGLKFPTDRLEFSTKGSDGKQHSDRLYYKSGRSWGELYTIQDDEGEVIRPLKEFKAKNKIAAQLIADACAKVVFKPIYDKVLDLHIEIQNGYLVLTTNDDYCGVIFRKKVDLDDCEPLDVIVSAQSFQLITAAMRENADLLFGVGNNSLHIKTPLVDCYHPIKDDSEVRDLLAYKKSIGSNDPKCKVTFKGKEASDVISSVLPMTYLAPTAKTVDNKITFTFDKKANTGRVEAESGAGVADGTFDLIGYECAESEIQFELSGVLTGQFMEKIGNCEVKLTVWDNQVFLQDFDEEILYILPICE